MTGKTNYDLSTFSKEGKIEDVKIGTKIWFMDEYETDVGIVIVDEEFKIRARWDSGTSQTVDKEGFNDYWGIVVENTRDQTQQDQNRHKYYDVIMHWANGGVIEFRSTCSNTSCWVELQNDESPYFNEEQLQWRIKPKTKTIRYRNALLKNNEVIALTSEPNLEDAYGDSAFLRWIDPGWKEIEVEI